MSKAASTGRLDFDLLGEAAAYPGHPITLAYLISRAFPSLAVARARGREFPAALEDCRIPGGGGAVYTALAYLDKMSRGVPLTELLELARGAWVTTCIGDIQQDPAIGQRQADGLADCLPEVVRWARGDNVSEQVPDA